MSTTTTLNAIREHSPCEDGWETLLESLGKTEADDEPLPLTHILKSNGIEHAIWALRSLPKDYKPQIIRFAADCAERVLHLYETRYPDDLRPREAINAARRWADEPTKENKKAATLAAARAAAARAAADAADASSWPAAAAARAAWFTTSAPNAANAAAAACAAADAAALAAAADAAANAAADAATAHAAAAAAEREHQATLFLKYFGG